VTTVFARERDLDTARHGGPVDVDPVPGVLEV
jgi:hypothetical protein